MASLKTCGFVALDGMDPGEAVRLMELLEGEVLGLKFNDLLDYDACGMLMRAERAGFVAWADAKLHDIPATVANRVTRLASYGANIITVHASGGAEMVKAAVTAYQEINNGRSKFGIAAVTVLTSLPFTECQNVYGADPGPTAERIGHYAESGGAYGLVCSAQEITGLKKMFPRSKLLVPGVRSAGAQMHDQIRVSTPANALANGADYLVIGREVTRAADPIEAIRRIDESIAHLP